MQEISLSFLRRIVKAARVNGIILVAFRGDKYKIISHGTTYGFRSQLAEIVDEMADRIEAAASSNVPCDRRVAATNDSSLIHQMGAK